MRISGCKDLYSDNNQYGLASFEIIFHVRHKDGTAWDNVAFCPQLECLFFSCMDDWECIMAVCPVCALQCSHVGTTIKYCNSLGIEGDMWRPRKTPSSS